MSRGRCWKTGKISYGSEFLAWNSAYHVIKRGICQDLQIYDCPHCSAIHLRTAKVQLHDWMWPLTNPEHLKICFGIAKVRNWFNQRGTIDKWDSV